MKYNHSKHYLSFTTTKTFDEFFAIYERGETKILDKSTGKSLPVKDSIIEFLSDPGIQDCIYENDFLEVFRQFRMRTRCNAMIVVHFFHLCGIDDYPKINKEEAHAHITGDPDSPCIFDRKDLDSYFEE